MLKDINIAFLIRSQDGAFQFDSAFARNPIKLSQFSITMGIILFVPITNLESSKISLPNLITFDRLYLHLSSG